MIKNRVLAVAGAGLAETHPSVELVLLEDADHNIFLSRTGRCLELVANRAGQST
ncbi:MAG: hypothetical protein ACYDAG_12545 [Chloroflexota bacterium]